MRASINHRSTTQWLHLRKLDQAARFTEQLVDKYPGQKTLQLSLALIHIVAGNHALAVPLLTELAAQDPQNLQVTKQLAICHTTLEDHRSALPVYLKWLEAEPEYLEALCGAGSAYNSIEQGDENIPGLDDISGFFS